MSRRVRVLPVLVALLAASGLLRGITGTNSAMALVADTKVDHPIAECLSETPEDLVQALITREEAVSTRETQLEERLVALSEAKESLRAQLDDLARAEAALNATMSRAQSAAEEDVAKLTSVYEAMSSDEAAQLFSEMDAAFAAGFVGRMEAEAAAKIMAGLTPETAYAISLVLAGRNSRVPTE